MISMLPKVAFRKIGHYFRHRASFLETTFNVLISLTGITISGAREIMASSSQGLRTVIQVVLAVAIIGLAYWLYISITEPWEAVERQQELTQMTRDRMDDIRSALIRYEREHDRYPFTLDSLVMFVQQDSLSIANPDSIFGRGFILDSMLVSPRTGQRFMYAVNDTARIKTYLLEDPNSDDYIGTIQADPSQLNAASWE